MKLVREHINEKFVEDSDPIDDLHIGPIRAFERLPKLFGEADKQLFIYTVYVEDDFIDFWFWEPHIKKLKLESKDKENFLLNYVIDIIENLGFHRFLVNPKMILHTDEDLYRTEKIVVTHPGMVRFQIPLRAQKIIPTAYYRRSEINDNKILFYTDVESRDAYLRHTEKFRVGLEEDDI